MIGLLSLLLAAQAAPAAQPVIRLRCHMMECGWYQLVSKEAVRSGEGFVLHRVTARRGSSVHRLRGRRPSDYPARYRPGLAIEWDTEATEGWVLCSRDNPTSMFRNDDGGWIAHRLNLFDLPGHAESSAYIYLNVCHGLAPAALTERRLRALGYQASRTTQQYELARPEDIFEHLGR